MTAVVAWAVLCAFAAPAGAEQAGSDVRSLQAGWFDAGGGQQCAVLAGGSLRCWGTGSLLGYGSTNNVGDGTGPTPTIGSVGPVPLGAGRTARAVSAGLSHTCAILDDSSLRCWGSGATGRLGYGNTNNVGDGTGPTPTIAIAGPVPLGAGRTARAITAGDSHSCAILDDSSVRCWGSGASGQLGYGNTNTVGDGTGPTPTIESAGPVPLGAGRSARAISAGSSDTCAILDDSSVRCWGSGASGRLGYGNVNNVGTGLGPTPTIESAGPVPLGAGRTARAIAAGTNITTCGLLDDGTARCWGGPANGQLGYGNNTNQIGSGTAPTPSIDSAGPLPVGAGRTVRAITNGLFHGAVILDDGTVRAWGGAGARLGYGNSSNVGAGAAPYPTIVSAGPVPLGEPLVATVADLSLTIGASPAALQVGGQGTVGVTVANAGPDDAPGAVVAVQVPGLAVGAATPSQGAFDAGSGIWTPGTVPAGGQATLTIPVTALAPGTTTAVAELIGMNGFDPDSTAANAAAAEDDRAATQIGVTAVPVVPPPAAPPADVTAPKLAASVPTKIALDKLRKGLTVTATPNEAAGVAFELLASPRKATIAATGELVLAAKSFSRATAKRTVKLVPSKRLLGSPRKAFTLRVRIIAVDASRNSTTVKRTVKVSIPKPKKKR